MATRIQTRLLALKTIYSYNFIIIIIIVYKYIRLFLEINSIRFFDRPSVISPRGSCLTNGRLRVRFFLHSAPFVSASKTFAIDTVSFPPHTSYHIILIYSLCIYFQLYRTIECSHYTRLYLLD